MSDMCVVKLLCVLDMFVVFFYKQKSAYDMRMSDWSSDVCSSDLKPFERHFGKRQSGLRDRRIVERAVKPAERRQSLRDKCLHVLFLCDVAPEIGGLPARRSDDRLTGLVVDVRHRDVGTTGHQ